MTSGSRPSSGISQNAVSSVPAILPAVLMAYRLPAERPMWSTPREAASRTPSGETMASSSDGTKNTIADARSEPLRAPSPSTSGSTTPFSAGTSAVNNPARAMIGASVRVLPKRSAICPPSQ